MSSTLIQPGCQFASDNTAVLTYAIYRDGQFHSTVPASLFRRIDPANLVTGLSPNTLYEFDVFACDAAGQVARAVLSRDHPRLAVCPDLDPGLRRARKALGELMAGAQ